MTAFGLPGSTTFYQQRMMNSSNALSSHAEGPPAYSPPLRATSADKNQSRFYRAQELNSAPPLIEIPLNHIGSSMSDNGSASGLTERTNSDDVLQDELSVMSQLLLGQQFIEMDRVITLEGTDFDFNVNSWGNLP
jgi:hypothetical protein